MMKKILVFVVFFLLYSSAFSQIKLEQFESRKLNTTRQLKIKLPKNYDASSKIKHPVIVVFDGDYLFEPVVGQVSYQTYFDGMPESIVVGVVQGYERFYDSFCDESTGLPIDSGARFYEFIIEELLPHLEKNYNTSNFRVAIGHDAMGNFINSFLVSDKPLFQAYINISPDFKGNMNQIVANRVAHIKEDVFYYLATSDADIASIYASVLETNELLKLADNKSFTYYYDELKGDTHYSMVPGALSKAMEQIFDIYKPLNEKELNEKVMNYEGTLDNYLVKRYGQMESLFGIHKTIPLEEFEKVAIIAEKREDWDSLEQLGKLANKQLPTSSLGTYYLALHAERTGKNKKAVKLYESALTLEETDKFTKEYILSQVEKLKFASEENEEKEEKDKL